ncbi:fasciclin-like arabinogalactan protein 17, partial [Phtheirospermum japonicum]
RREDLAQPQERRNDRQRGPGHQIRRYHPARRRHPRRRASPDPQVRPAGLQRPPQPDLHLRRPAAGRPGGRPAETPPEETLRPAARARIPAGPPHLLRAGPGPSLAPAPAPGPGGPHHHFDGESQVKDFIQTLLHYGGYNELADILVNLTSLSTEMGKLVSEGYVLTVLAPNDEAMAKLTAEQLSEPGAPEQMVYYHLIPEYQTEESMYNAVRRFGKLKYDTLRLPHRVEAVAADGSVRFGSAEDGYGYLIDADIYTDGRISVQGIDNVLFPAVETQKAQPKAAAVAKIVSKPRRGTPFFF